MTFQPMEPQRGSHATPTLFVGVNARSKYRTPFIQLNRAALECMGFAPGETARLVLAWDPETVRFGLFPSKDDSGRYVRHLKTNKSNGLKISITGEIHKYQIPIDDILGKYPLIFDKESGYWVADCGRGINRSAIRNRLNGRKGVAA